ncbi:MAG: gliding motility-associated C-terminal domain-containing protein [Flavobacteriales bacterium]|nr:gliding motility-associated C-terminal domain-containing protein [Flavobacteriales bacterium]
MRKDLFEDKIGEALRGAESTPPSGSWDFIKSQIPAQYTPPFKFPTWAVIGVASTMLAGMSLMETTSYESSVVPEFASYEEVIEELSSKSVGEFTSQMGNEISNQELGESSLVEENFIAANEIEHSTEEIDFSQAEEPHAFTAEAKPSELITRTEPQDVKPVNAANSGQSLGMAKLVVENSPSPLPSAEEASNTENTQENALVKQFSVEGPKECFTPCNLKLKATGTATDYNWEAGIYGTAEGDQLNLLIEEPQNAMIFATAKYRDGSEEIISHEIEVKKGSKLFVPNSFTPNGDGINDSYAVSGIGITEFSLTIINSNGKVIHQATDMSNAWNVEGVSSELEGEFYIAVVRARGIDGKVYEENIRLTINP